MESFLQSSVLQSRIFWITFCLIFLQMKVWQSSPNFWERLSMQSLSRVSLQTLVDVKVIVDLNVKLPEMVEIERENGWLWHMLGFLPYVRFTMRLDINRIFVLLVSPNRIVKIRMEQKNEWSLKNMFRELLTSLKHWFQTSRYQTKLKLTNKLFKLILF